jgi:hypothetical protein
VRLTAPAAAANTTGAHERGADQNADAECSDNCQLTRVASQAEEQPLIAISTILGWSVSAKVAEWPAIERGA